VEMMQIKENFADHDFCVA